MSICRLLLIVLGTILVSTASSHAANVLYNGDFETGASDFRGWTQTTGTTAYTIVVDDPDGPGNSIQGVETGSSLGRLLQEVNLKVGAEVPLTLSGWIKTTNVTSEGGVVIGVGTVNADGALVAGSFSVEVGGVVGTTNWTFYESVEFVLPELPSGSVSYAVYLDFNGAGGGTANFDDVSLDIGLSLKQPNFLWVDFAHTGIRRGTEELPLGRLVEASHSIKPEGGVYIQPGESHETLVISRPMTLTNFAPGEGTVTIGTPGARRLGQSQTGFISKPRTKR